MANLTTTHLTRLAKRPASNLLLITVLSCCAACSAERIPVRIDFEATWAGQPIRCDSTPWSLSDLRFFVSDVLLLDSAGAGHRVALTQDERWQQQQIALIDLEDSSGGCVNGTEGTHATIDGTVDTAKFVAIRFTVGVPFNSNHANPLLAQAPLDNSAMHWHWRSGYKFLRAGIATPADGFWLHLGSTACEGSIQNISGCLFPNRVTVELSDFSPTTDTVTIELEELFRGVELDDGVRTDCSSGPAESACAKPFEALGLPFDGITNEHPQRVFRVRN